MSHKPVLTAEHYSFSYETLDQPTLDDLTFSLYDNEATLLIGPSGSGKSSLSLCLNGLYPDAVEGVASGEIFYRGHLIKDFAKGALNQQIGIVFQDPESQFCMITVEDELAFTLENCQVPRDEIEHRINQILNHIGMIDYKQQAIHTLSGGQKQKIALASVLLLEPDVLILDEPTANLDPMSRLEFIQLIEQLRMTMALTILIIEHQADDWLKLIDRALVLNQDGQLIEDGPVDTIFQTKQTVLMEHGIFIPEQYRRHNHPRKPTIDAVHRKPCLAMKNVSFSRNHSPILQHINMTFHQGEMIAIVGENGAGKSTLLQLIARLLQPNDGAITFLEKSLNDWKEAALRQHMGFVFQNPEHQFLTDTTYDEVAFSMTLNGYDYDTINRRTTQLLSDFQLLQEKWQNPFALSGGQKRRLSVATMLDETPDLLLFDEPTFGQDAQTTAELMHLMTNIQKQGTTIVFVTHDMDLVDQYCESVYVLHDQKVQYYNDPKTLWQQDTLLNQARLRKPSRLEEEKVGVVHGVSR
ncbi:energy-coupling factor transport system ATP-binding protein [Alkalibacillus flavidus]|uniref:Energy-coupling factor transport system ATP-binding protein n=1 Tax=Alkalibacillus flavidus TaxID=546021 RepID=A0ABV2KXN8_9BACI